MKLARILRCVSSDVALSKPLCIAIGGSILFVLVVFAFTDVRVTIPSSCPPCLPPAPPCPAFPTIPPLRLPDAFLPARFSATPKFGAPVPAWTPVGQFPSTERLPAHLAGLCAMDSCFDFTKCLDHAPGGLPWVYVYNTTTQSAWLAAEIFAFLRSRPYVTTNPSQACIFIPDLELHCLGNGCHTGLGYSAQEKLEALPFWDNGRNHLLYSEHDFSISQWASLIGLETPDRAILVSTNFHPGEPRAGFDVPIPLESRAPLDFAKWTPKSAHERKYLASFRGSRYHGCGEPIRSALRWIRSHDVPILLKCGAGVFDLLCNKDAEDYDRGPGYEELLRDSKFGLAVRGCGMHSYRLSELIRAGTVPVILADGFQPPLSEISSPLFRKCAMQFPESFLPQLIPFLRNVTNEEIDERIGACGKLYDVWSAGRGRASNLRAERFEAVLKTLGARLGYLDGKGGG